MTFKEYIAARKPTSDSAGDLARLASWDSFPDMSTVKELEAYVIAHFGTGSLSDAVPDLWKTYASAAKRHQRD